MSNSRKTESSRQLLLADFHVKTSQAQGQVGASSANDQGSGRRCFDSSEMYGQRGQLLKTYQPFDLKGLPWSYKISARSGIALNGTVYPLLPLALLTAATGSGLWPTPCARDHKDCGPNVDWEKVEAGELSREEAKAMLNGKDPFEAQGAVPAKMWPTPQASDVRDRGHLGMPAIQRRLSKGKQLNLSMVVSQTSGALNPTWVEWLMGFPIGWTDSSSSATP